METKNDDLMAALKARNEKLFVIGVRSILIRRKNKDGTFAYQSFLNRIKSWENAQDEKRRIDFSIGGV